MTRAWALVLLGTIAAGLSACEKATPAAAVPPPAISLTYGGAPVSITIEVDKAEITTAERIAVDISIAHDSGYIVTIPGIGDRMGPWTVVHNDRGPATFTPSGRLSTTMRLVLEPTLAGEYEVPPLAVTYRSALDHGASDQPVTLATKPIAIRVASVLAAAASPTAQPALAPLRDALPAPAAGGRGVHPAVIAAGGVGVAGLVVASAVLIARRRRRRTIVPAWQAALPRLEAMVARASDADALLTEASAVLHEWLECGAAETPENVARSGADGEPCGELRGVIDNLQRELDGARFGPARVGVETARALAMRVVSLIGTARDIKEGAAPAR